LGHTGEAFVGSLEKSSVVMVAIADPGDLADRSDGVDELVASSIQITSGHLVATLLREDFVHVLSEDSSSDCSVVPSSDGFITVDSGHHAGVLGSGAQVLVLSTLEGLSTGPRFSLGSGKSSDHGGNE